MATRRSFLFWFASVAALPSRLFSQAGGTLRRQDLERVDAGPGELIHLLRGDRHGFDGLSLILAESAPGGGPPLHTHDCEEVHVVESGRVSYVVGEARFTVEGPFVQRIPAGVPHAFINASDTPLKIIAVFSSREYRFTFRGPNPLWKTPKEQRS